MQDAIMAGRSGPSTLAPPPRPTLAQNLVNSMPPIIPAGNLDPSLAPLSTGVTKELEPHFRKLKEEEARLREEMRAKQEKLRKNLRSKAIPGITRLFDYSPTSALRPRFVSTSARQLSIMVAMPARDIARICFGHPVRMSRAAVSPCRWILRCLSKYLRRQRLRHFLHPLVCVNGLEGTGW